MASDWIYPTFDATFFNAIQVDPTTQLVKVEVSPYQVGGEPEWKLRVYESPASSAFSFCQLSQNNTYFPFKLDCGLQVLGFASSQKTAVYYFLLKSAQADWLEVIRKPGQPETVWLDRKASGKNYTVLSIPAWLAQGSFLTSSIDHGEISFQLYATPSEGSNVILSRTVPRLRFGKIPEDGYAVVDPTRTAKGEWLPVEWVSTFCQPTSPMNVYCGSAPVINASGLPCTKGWVRWRSESGKLIYYPFYTSNGMCPSTGYP